ncbi:hypothetical protein FRC06_009443, partial [Ceratobasidium sp. 370]
MSLILADAFRLSITFSQGPYVYDTFMSIVIACIMLYNLMGWTTFAGYAVLFLALPFNSLIVYRAAALHRAEAAMRDQHMQAVNEAIQAIKFIKFSTWESRWVNWVLDVRQTELQWLRKLKVVYFFINMMWDTVPIFVAAISFSCFTLVAKRELTVDIAFPCIAIFGMLSLSLTARANANEAYVEEQIAARNDEHEHVFELKDIGVIFPEGVISLVCGPTGSGKSALLAALLGEMDLIKGEIFLPKVPNHLHELKSIKDNILFGSQLEKERYEVTLSCCALLPDLAVLEDSDNTEIGKKGVSLSGGQKARVALARAVYSRTQVVLLDDILSAVDSHTAKEIVNQCLLGPLMAHRTVVLVTHHTDLVLPIAGWVVKLHEGRVEAQGTVAQLRDSGSAVIGLRRAK